MFNGVWLFSFNNYFRIQPPTDLTRATIFACVAAILVPLYAIQCLLILLPRHQGQPRPRTIELGECEICTDDMTNSNVFMGYCKHMYHSDCMIGWLR